MENTPCTEAVTADLCTTSQVEVLPTRSRVRFVAGMSQAQLRCRCLV